MKKLIKKMIIMVLMIALFVAICPKSYAIMNPTLADIVGVFNSCNVVKLYNQNPDDLDMIASSNQETKTLTIQITENSVVTNLTYKLDDDGILTGKYSDGDATIRQYWITATKILIDCIEQCHDYAEGEMFDTLNSNQVANYTLEEQGLKITDKSGNLYWVEVNINKAIPTVDTYSYIKVTDLDELKDNLTGDGIAKLKKGKALFYKYTIDNKQMLIVGEQGKFSYVINKTIQSLLQVMFNSEEVVEYYKKNYPAVLDNKQFAGFKIEVNPIKNDIEESVFGADNTYQFVRIAIEKDAVKTAMEGKKDSEDEDKDGLITVPEQPKEGTPSNPITSNPPSSGTGEGSTTTYTKTELPNTGSFLEYLKKALFATAAITSIGLLIFVVKTRNK